MDWYYVAEGRKTGPLPQEKLVALAHAGKVTPETPVWRGGMAGWEPLRQALPQALSQQPQSNAGEQGARNASTPGEGAVCPSCGNMVPGSQLTQVDGRSLCVWCKAKLEDEVTARDMAAMVAAGARHGGLSDSVRGLTGKFQQRVWNNPAFWEEYKGAVTLTVVVACAVMVALAAECVGLGRYGILAPRLVASVAVVLVAKRCRALDSHYGKFVLVALALFALDDIVTGLRIGYRYRLLFPFAAYTLLAVAMWGLGFDVKYFWSAMLPMAFLGCLAVSSGGRVPRATLLLLLGGISGSVAMAAMAVGARIQGASLLVPAGAVTSFAGFLCLLQGRYGGVSLTFILLGTVLHYAGACLLAFSTARARS